MSVASLLPLIYSDFPFSPPFNCFDCSKIWLGFSLFVWGVFCFVFYNQHSKIFTLSGCRKRESIMSLHLCGGNPKTFCSESEFAP